MPGKLFFTERPDVKGLPRTFGIMLLLTMGWTFLAPPVQADGQEPVVAPGRTVQFEYTLLRADGSIVASSEDTAPFRYVHGRDQIFPRLEKALAGLAVDEKTSITLAPEDSYGLKEPEAYIEIPIDEVPKDGRTVGAPLALPGYDWPLTVSEVRMDRVVLDLNHPLAGETLTFNIRITSIR